MGPSGFVQTGPTVIQRWNPVVGAGAGSVPRTSSTMIWPWRGPFDSGVGRGLPVVPLLLIIGVGALVYATFFGKKRAKA